MIRITHDDFDPFSSWWDDHIRLASTSCGEVDVSACRAAVVLAEVDNPLLPGEDVLRALLHVVHLLGCWSHLLRPM
jgi:hypothetical protein